MKTPLLLFILSLIPFLSTAASVKLAWDPNPSPGVYVYYLYRGTDPGLYSDRTLVLASGKTESVQTWLQPGLTYYFAVCALSLEWCEDNVDDENDQNGEREGPWLGMCFIEGELSDEVSFTVLIEPPYLDVTPIGVLWKPDFWNFDEMVVTALPWDPGWQLVPSYWFINIRDGFSYLPRWRYPDEFWNRRLFRVIRTRRWDFPWPESQMPAPTELPIDFQ